MTLPESVTLILSDGSKVNAQLVDENAAMRYFNVAVLKGLQAIYEVGDIMFTIDGVESDGKQFSSFSTLKQITLQSDRNFPVGQTFVTPDDLRYGVEPKGDEFVLTTPASVKTRPLTNAEVAATRVIWYSVSDAAGKTLFQTSDKKFAIKWLKVNGGGMLESVGPWPDVSVALS